MTIATDQLTRALLDMAARGERAHCSDPASHHLWLSDYNTERATAVMLCDHCPVLTVCRDTAEQRDERWGVWGGVDFSVRPGRKKLHRQHLLRSHSERWTDELSFLPLSDNARRALIMARFYRLPVTPVTATYGASVTTTSRNLITALTGTVAALMLIGLLAVLNNFTGEYWCEDRVPWWGPPTDPNSDCSGFAWSEKHPGEYPWTLPR